MFLARKPKDPQQLLDAYLDHLRAERGLARNTLESYSRDLLDFINWAEDDHNRPVIHLQGEDLRFYFLKLKQKGLSSRSIARKISSIRGLYRYWLREGEIEADPSLLLEVPRLDSSLPKDLTMEEVDRLLAQPKSTDPLGIRDHAMLEILYATGLRRAEAESLNIKDVDFEDRTIRVKGKGEKVRIFDNSYDIDMGEHGKIKINYWTLEPIEESGEKTKWRDIRKGFVSRNSAVFITLNGQRHGVEKKSFLNDDANLKYSDDYIIVQVDCDNLTNYAKKKLLSSTRERLKEGEMKEILMEELATHLRNDRNLLAFEKKRKNEILSAKTHRDTSKIRKMVGKFISRNPELNKLLLKQGKEDISGTKQPKTKVEKEEEEIEDQIKDEELESPDLMPEPTFLKIANAKDPIPIEKGGSALVRLETDAEDSYLEEGNEERFRCIHQSNQTTPKSLSQLRGGKISYYVHCPRSIWVGTKETLRFELDRANKPALVVEREITCRKPFKRKKRKRETKLQEPSIKFISKKDSLWNQLSYDNNSVGQIYLAGKDSAIIVSMENIHLQKALRTRRLKESLIETVKDRYGAAIAYYLLLQEVDKKKKVKEAIDESNDSPELQRLAKTISLLALPTEAL